MNIVQQFIHSQYLMLSCAVLSSLLFLASIISMATSNGDSFLPIILMIAFFISIFCTILCISAVPQYPEPEDDVSPMETTLNLPRQ